VQFILRKVWFAFLFFLIEAVWVPILISDYFFLEALLILYKDFLTKIYLATKRQIRKQPTLQCKRVGQKLFYSKANQLILHKK
jgi:hypothetical protein